MGIYPHGKRNADTGCQRQSCPAQRGFVRCPLVPGSMSLSVDTPIVLNPPSDPPPCCTQVTMTVPPEIAGKARQKYPYLSPRHRASFNRRSGVERGYANVKNKACEDLSPGRV